MGLLDDDSEEIVLVQQTISRRRNPLPLLLGVAGLAALAATQLPSGTDPAVFPDSATSSTTIPAPSTTTSPAVPDDPAPFSFPEISLVSRSADGEHMVAVPFSAPGEVRELGGPFSSFGLDSSGQFMAALLGTDDGGSPRTLVVGHVGGDFNRLVSESASGFAWHDSQPGTVAFIEAARSDQTSLQVLDVLNRDSAPATMLSTDGELRHFGSWGFVTTQVDNPGFRMFDSAGGETFVAESGAPVEYVPTIGLLATMAPGDHMAIDPVTGETTQLPMFSGHTVLWQLSTGGPRGTYAVQASGDRNHNVLVLNRLNEVVARLPGASDPLAMRWDPTGTKLVYAIDDSTDHTTLIVYDAGTGTTIETTFPEDPLHPETVGIIVE
ncbi:MAG: hypothetical protein KJN63_04995 [Acidimicrobiia bacterium]|nr:hypothetical protein [Acidimicrobiia bacterium]